jgi:6-phosphogluconate dehydrogenase (decarboxylating)
MAEAASRIGLAGLAVMGQNLALNIAEKGFPISVYNRTDTKVDETVERAKEEGDLPLTGYKNPRDFVLSIQKPRSIIMLVKAGAPVDQTIQTLSQYMEPGDCLIDGGNEWYENTERRAKQVAEKGLLYLGMGVSGGEEGARNGPSMMPGGTEQAYHYIEDVVTKVAAQVDDGPCVTYVGRGGAGNYVKMIHNGIEYGDMQLISEAYDVLKSVGGLTNEELHTTFAEWNEGELESFLVEITRDIFSVKDDKGEGFLVDKILDKTGMKGTGKWTVQQAAELSIAAPTIAASLDSRFLSGLKEERLEAARIFREAGVGDILAVKEAAGGRCEKSALCFEDLQLRAGDEPHPGQEHRAGVGPEFGRACTDLEGRVHHPGEVSGPDQEGLRPQPGAGVPAHRPGVHQGDGGAAGRLAESRLPRNRSGRLHSWHDCLSCILRHLPERAPACESRPSATRLLRCAHVRARRHAGVLPHGVVQDLQAVRQQRPQVCEQGRRPKLTLRSSQKVPKNHQCLSFWMIYSHLYN